MYIINAIKDLHNILQVKGLDAILIGPYDLSASMGITGQFDKPEFESPSLLFSNDFLFSIF